LPERIHLRTRTETFTETRYLAVRDGRIWEKPIEATTGRREPWRLLGGTGLPRNDQDRGFAPPARVAEISSDVEGGHLIALSDRQAIYDVRKFDGRWKDKWGLPAKKLAVLPANRGWASSTRPAGSSYTDPGGHVHESGIGVTSLYLLGAAGTDVYYGDSWLPDFQNRICGPARGRFVAEGFAAAGSTLFVVNRYGDLYTRLADFDTEGHDPFFFLKYSYDPKSPEWKRVLPGEDWVRQPKIPGRITKVLTVVQTGKSSGDRELRVEGMDDRGQRGYWRKHLRGDAWTFVPTGAGPVGPLLDNRPQDLTASTLAADRETKYAGTLRVRWLGGSRSVPVEILQFQIDCGPALVRLWIGNRLYEAKLHVRSFYFKGLVLGTLELPDELLSSRDPEASKVVNRGLGGKKYVGLKVNVSRDGLRLHNLLYTIDLRAQRR
jgi:hypothetical protein